MYNEIQVFHNSLIFPVFSNSSFDIIMVGEFSSKRVIVVINIKMIKTILFGFDPFIFVNQNYFTNYNYLFYINRLSIMVVEFFP